jgi:hypothetical protein
MKISHIEWGEDSAEKDKDLLQYFVTSDALRRLTNKSKSIVIGRKGSGKSALLAKLKQEFSLQPNTLVVTVSPKYNSIRSVLNDEAIVKGFAEEVFFQHTWLRHIYLDILCLLGDQSRGNLTSGSAEFARKIAIEQQRTSKDLVENISEIFRNITVKAGALGEFGINVEKELRQSADVDSLEFHANTLTKDCKIVVLIDDLDLGWDNSPTANSMLLGLLSATTNINSKHSSIHTITFLREDIYTVILTKTQHADKYRNVEKIRWDKDSLIRVLEMRINFNRTKNGLPKIADAFETVFPVSIGTAYTENWLVERTLSRPRELIQLVRSYTESVEGEMPSDDVLKTAETGYSSWKLADVCSEYSNQYPSLNVVTAHWSTKFRRQKYHLKYTEISELLLVILSEVQINFPWFNEIVANTDIDKMLNILYEVGIIGDFVLGGPGGSKTYYSYEDFHEPRFDEIQIHPCFRRALNTVERIRA